MDSINLKKFIFREGDNFEATGQQREVHIKFICNHKKPLGEPQFSNQLGNKYFFDFQTSLVCPASAVECFVRKGNLTYDLTPLGLIAGKKSTVKSIRDRRRPKRISYFIDAWLCFLVAAILNLQAVGAKSGIKNLRGTDRPIFRKFSEDPMVCQPKRLRKFLGSRKPTHQ